MRTTSRNYEYKGHWFHVNKNFKSLGNTIFWYKPYWDCYTMGSKPIFIAESNVSLSDLRKKIREYVDSKSSNLDIDHDTIA